MKQFIITCLFSLLLVGCVTESVRIIPIKVSVKAGVDFNPCGSEVEGYKFEPNGIISISCTNGNIYSVRNRQQLEKMKKTLLNANRKAFTIIVSVYQTKIVLKRVIKTNSKTSQPTHCNN